MPVDTLVQRPAADVAVPTSASAGHRPMRAGPLALWVPPPGRWGAPCLACLAARLASHGWPPPVPAGFGCPPGIDASDPGLPVPALWVDTGDGGWSPHCALPLPGCDCGGAAGSAAATKATGRPIDAVSPFVGLVGALRTWRESALETPGLPCAMAVAEVAALGPLGSVAGALTGAGSGAAGPAVAAALGEALERYAAGFVPAGLPVCRAAELGEPHMAASPAWFGGLPIGDDTRLRWARGQRLVDGSVCWVPAAAVYFPYVCHDAEPPRSVGSSEGLAAGACREDAVRHALLEVIERDSFMRAWRWGAPRWRLPNPFPDRTDLDFALIGNRFGVPVVAAFSESAAVPYALAGLAARLDLDDAVRAAASEATGARALFDRIQRPAARRALEARYAHATDPQWRAARRAFMAAPPAPPRPAALAWERCLERVPDAVVVDVTTRDVALLGLSVVRAVLPGAFGFEPTPGPGRMGGRPAPIPY